MKISPQFTSPLFFSFIILVGLYFIPWQHVSWGQIQFKPASTITVTGNAQKQEQNQEARFSAGVSVLDEDKEAAIAQVNENVSSIIQTIKEFGIPEENIQTQNISIHQRRELNDDAGKWDVSNTIEISQVEADQTAELSDLLAASPATNVYGPSFSLKTEQRDDASLMADAIENAREKAQAAAEANGQSLGEIISVTEGGASDIGIPRAMMDGLGGGTPVQPGTSTVGQTVTVVFELK